MIAVDVNILAYLWIPGEMTAFAEAALKRDPHWITSILWRSEMRNILTGYIRRGQLDVAVAERCLASAESQMAGFEFIVPSRLVMKKVVCSECSAYDCEYVALADDLNVSLVTSDRKILKQFAPYTIGLKVFAEGKR